MLNFTKQRSGDLPTPLQEKHRGCTVQTDKVWGKFKTSFQLVDRIPDHDILIGKAKTVATRFTSLNLGGMNVISLQEAIAACGRGS